MNTLVAEARRHLKAVLGTVLSRDAGQVREEAVPYGFRDRFDLATIDDLGPPAVLAAARRGHRGTPVELRIAIERLRGLLGTPVVYVTDALASHERRGLIAQRVPFVVPGNQVYLPDLGIDLRETFRRRVEPRTTAVSPATQAMLIAVLLRQDAQSAWAPAEIGAALGYTAMTVSRALREIESLDIANAERRKRVAYLQFTAPARDTWTRLLPNLRDPVQRTVFVDARSAPRATTRRAGLTALADRTMLQAPDIPVFAIDHGAWRDIASTIDVRPAAEPGVEAWQVWRYATSLDPGDTVDPLSLFLSLRGDADERVQASLDDLLAQMPW